jgi:hypothetical protein
MPTSTRMRRIFGPGSLAIWKLRPSIPESSLSGRPRLRERMGKNQTFECDVPEGVLEGHGFVDRSLRVKSSPSDPYGEEEFGNGGRNEWDPRLGRR